MGLFIAVFLNPPYSEDPIFCDVYGNICFETSMESLETEENCTCPMECNSITYSFNIVSTPFDPVKMCPSKKRTNAFLMKEFYGSALHYRFPTKYVRRIIGIRDNTSYGDDDICKEKIKYRAEIIFRLATNAMSVTVMSRRLSFFDQLSAFGRKQETSPVINKNITWADEVRRKSCRFIKLLSGGILGLFTGISIMSMVEVLFWILRYVVRNVGRGRKKMI